jgi:hypothetical protein
VNVVGPGYFATLGITVLAGSDFEAGSSPKDEIVVNAALARAFWPERSALGETVRLVRRDGTLRAMRVRGVVADAKPDFVGLPVEPRIYKSALVEPFALGHLYVRIHGGVPTMRAVDSAVKAMLPSAPTPAIAASVEENRTQSLRFLDGALAVARVLGVITLVLAVVGLYSLQHFMISRRRKEFGIRLALGARPRHLVALVGRDCGFAILAGAALGLPIALALGRLSSSVVPGLHAVGGAAIAGAVGLLAVALVGASIAPLVSALHVEPLDAIRRN